MTPTSDERREVAERLRKCEAELSILGADCETAFHVIDKVIGCREEDSWERFLARLADLIDPTCKVSSVETYDNELGQLEGWEFHLTCGHSYQWPWNEPTAYCPECGARVVERGDA